jgi:hypothetical protein
MDSILVSYLKMNYLAFSFPGLAVYHYLMILENDRYIDGKSIYWRLTICKMTRYRRVSSGNRGKMSKVRDLFPLPFGNTGNAEPAFSDTLSIS